ncbi:MAG: protein phosphatase 2C domain-containing protein [Bryobacteraceae bacterium]|nr:protein phosphatase 2C domain-containing protein [Bryobacteraceae bacterium]MDW8377263.1 protein phosphatase 2C domain-containing protein [Bryobacterales bacterium]
MHLVFSSTQHQGARSEQQDAYAVFASADEAFRRHGGELVVVADGMGGLAHGALASQTAVDRFVAAYQEKRPEESVARALSRSLEAANTAVYQLAAQKQVAGEMGTTLVAGAFLDSQLFWISVGDSGVFYRPAKGPIRLLNTPHTLGAFLAQQAEKGLLRSEVAQTHPERDALTCFLGLERISQVDCNEKPLMLEPGDVVVFATDGLFKFLDQDAMEQTIPGDPATLAQRLVKRTLQLGHPQQDNITVVSATRCKQANPVFSTIASVIVIGGLIALFWFAKRWPGGPGQTQTTSLPPVGEGQLARPTEKTPTP